MLDLQVFLQLAKRYLGLRSLQFYILLALQKVSYDTDKCMKTMQAGRQTWYWSFIVFHQNAACVNAIWDWNKLE